MSCWGLLLLTTYLLENNAAAHRACACIPRMCVPPPVTCITAQRDVHSTTCPPCCSLHTVIRYSGFFTEGSYSVANRPWFLSFTFAVACCVIVSGCLAERTRLLVYPTYTGEHIHTYTFRCALKSHLEASCVAHTDSRPGRPLTSVCVTASVPAVVLVSIVHPLIVHWVWVRHSWLNRVSSCPVLDYAGGLPVHTLGESHDWLAAAHTCQQALDNPLLGNHSTLMSSRPDTQILRG